MKDAPRPDKPFSRSGKFWLVGTEEATSVPGNLRYVPDSLTRLQTLGRMSGDEIYENADGPPIVARFSDGMYGLLNAIHIGGQMGYDDAVIWRNYACRDLFFLSDSPIELPTKTRYCTLEISDLDILFNKWGYHFEDSDPRDHRRTTIIFEDPREYELNFDSTRIVFRMDAYLNSVWKRTHEVTRTAKVYLISAEARDSQYFLDLAWQLKALVMLFTFAPATFLSIQFGYTHSWPEQDRIFTGSASFYSQGLFRSSNSRFKKHRKSLLQFRRTFMNESDLAEELPRIVSRWLAWCTETPEFSHSFIALELKGFSYLEGDFLKAFQVMETFYRSSLKLRKAVNHEKCLAWILDQLSPTLRKLLEFDQKEKKELLSVRNYLTHYDPRLSNFNNPGLIINLTNKMRGIIRCLALSKLGLNTTVIESKMREFINPRWFWF